MKPMAGSDFTVNMTAKDKDGNLIDLVGATVTIEYVLPSLELVEDIVPTNVDTDNSIITYKIQDTISVQGQWYIGAKVITLAGDIRYVNPRTPVYFDRRG